MSGITQGFIGELWVGTIGSGIRIPILTGASAVQPENFALQDPVTSNLFEDVYTGGLVYPIISMPVYVTQEWWAAATLNTWFNLPRVGTGPYYDVAALTNCYIWIGVTGQVWQLWTPKVNMLSVGYSQGAFVDARLELWGLAMTPVSASVPTATPFLSVAAKSQNCAHTFAKNFTRIDMSFHNNLILNDECPSVTDRGSSLYLQGLSNYDYNSVFERPIEINATRFTSTASATFQAQDVTGLPGSTPSIVDATEADVNIWAPQASKTTTGVTIELLNPLYSGRYNATTMRPRNRRTLNIITRGATDGSEPISFNTWTPT